MPMINPLPLLKEAQQKKIAIPAFNVHTMEMIQAVVETAAEEGSPVIIQTTPGTLKHAGIPYIAANVKVAAEGADIPVALHLDHCPVYDTVIKCIKYGYTSVMIDGSKLPYKDNVQAVKEIVKVAHAADVPVEAELGNIGGTEDELTVSEKEAALTIPEEAQRFVAETGVDYLAVAIGTAHGVYQGEPELDFERLAAINRLVNIPLVLHGASGVPDKSVREAIDRGICKVNIATELKIPMAEAIKNYFKQNPDGSDPRHYLGAGKEAVKEIIRFKIRLCGSSGLLG